MTIPKLVEKARKQFKAASDAEATNRQLALEDLRFVSGDQWPQEVMAERRLDNRPCLTINRLPQFVKQVTNEQRQQRPQIQVNPVDSGGDVETAEVFQGLIRHVEVASQAEQSYDSAFESLVRCGFGAWRVITEWESEASFDQVIRIERIENPFTIYLDPAAKRPDKADARWAFEVEDLTKEEFEATYPKAEVCGIQDFSSIGDGAAEWFRGGQVRVARYWWIEEQPAVLYLMPDGQTVTAEESEILAAQAIQTRKTTLPKVRWAKINGIEILEQGEWAGRYIPIVMVYGDEICVDGERIYSGMVRNAQDPARMYNYWNSAATETIALAPRAPFVGVEGQFEGHEAKWQNANRKNYAYLEYKPKSIAGDPAPPPQRQSYEPPVQAIMSAIGQADNDLKAVTGIYDASLGARGPQESGRAILARQAESDTANINYVDNLSRGILHTAKILIDLIPKIYDTARVVRIIKPDESQQLVALNEAPAHSDVDKIYRLDAGKYDVTVSVGPSYQSQRQQAVASMLDLTSKYPQLAQLAGDLLVKNMDWPGAQEIAKRLRKTLPPELQDEQEGQQVPPQVAAQLQQLQVMNQQLVEEMNALSDAANAKRMELESKERIAALQAQVQLVIAESKVAGQMGLESMKQEFARLSETLAALAGPEPGTAPETAQVTQ